MFFVVLTGLDSTPNDGIYTGVLTANQMAGDGYYNIRVSSTYISLSPGSLLPDLSPSLNPDEIVLSSCK